MAEAMEKHERLRRLANLTPDVPRTYWSVDEFRNSILEQSEKLYRIRTAETTVSVADEPLSDSEVLVRVASALPTAAVIQEYVAPILAGVTLVSDSVMLIEGVRGPASALLRSGCSGTRWAAPVTSGLFWSTGAALTSDERDQLGDLHRFALQRVRSAADWTMYEWILGEDGRFYWVDLKILSEYYLKNFLPDRPARYVVGGREPSDLPVRLPDTSLLHFDVVNRRPAGIVCSGGSPLAHLCVASFRAGVPLVVEDRDDLIL
jgi:hypothetical protein